MELLQKLFYDPEISATSVRAMQRELKERGIKMKKGKIKNFIEDQELTQRLKTVNKKKFNSFIPKGVLDQVQIDLIFLKNKFLNKGFPIMLSAIDTFSKFGLLVPMKNKTAGESVRAMNIVLDTVGIPKTVYSDKGSEFINKQFVELMDDHNIELVFALNHASFVERFNRTMKERINKYLLSTGTKTWIKALPLLVRGYNNTIHSATDMRPRVLHKVKEKRIIEKVRDRIFHRGTFKRKHSLIEIGDKVRIELKQTAFSKGHHPKWSKDFYEVEEIDGSKYYLKGLERPYLRAELLLIRDVAKNPLPALLEGTLEGRLKEQAKLPKLPADIIKKTESISKRKAKRKIKKPKKLDL